MDHVPLQDSYANLVGGIPAIGGAASAKVRAINFIATVCHRFAIARSPRASTTSLASHVRAAIPRPGAIRDAWLIGLVTVMAFWINGRFSIVADVVRFVAAHTRYSSEDCLLGALTLLAGTVFYLIRRWREALREITSRTAAEAVLRDAIDSIPGTFGFYDRDDRVVMFNETHRKLFPERAALMHQGMPFEDFLRRLVAAGEHPEAIGHEEEWIAQLVQQRRAGRGSLERQLRDGRCFLVTEARMRNGGLAVLGVDITEMKRAQEALRASELRVRDFAVTSSDWFWEQDADLRFTMIGAHSPKVIANSRVNIGKRRWDLVDMSRDPECWEQHLRELMERKPFRDFQFEQMAADGKLHHVTVSGVPVFDGSGEFIGYRGTGREISKQVEAEHELRAAKIRAEQAEELLRDAVDSISEGLIIYDRDDRVVMCNDSYRAIYPESGHHIVPGAGFEELVRHGLATGDYPDALGREAAWFAERVAQHRAANATFEHPRGNDKWMLVTERRMRNGGTVGMRVDISALKSAQTALRDSEQRLDRAQEIAGIGSWEFDILANRFTWSKNMYRLRGLSPKTFDPTGQAIPSHVHPDDRPAARRHREDLAAGVRRDPIDLRVIHPSGEIKVMRVDGRPIEDPDGVIRRLSGTMQDVTERRLIEQHLAQGLKMEAIGNLTGGMAHDFNNVLGVVIGNLDLLGRSIKDNRIAEELRAEALAGALRGADLTRRLLAFARRQPLRPKPTDANALVERVVRLLDRILGEDITLKPRLDPMLWKVIVDPTQLESTLTNLAANARDAMPKGGRLDITTHNICFDADGAGRYSEVTPGEYVVIEVSDTGCGIAPEILSRVFEPFFTTKEQGKGTGLGLSMVFGFVKQSGGHVTAESEPGQGSTFRLYLPRARVEQIAPDMRVEAASAAGGHETVLVVEDNAPLRRATVRQLTSLGYQVVSAEDGGEALTILDSNRTVDLLFTDVVMPGAVNGLDLAEYAARSRPGIKVLLVSGFPDLRGAEPRLATRHRLLSKPFRQEELAKAIRETLDGHGAKIAA